MHVIFTDTVSSLVHGGTVTQVWGIAPVIIAAGISALASILGRKVGANSANKNAAAEAAYKQAEAQRAINDKNKLSAREQAAANQRFNMAVGILRSMQGENGGGPISAAQLDMLEKTRDSSPMIYSSATAPPVAKQQGFNFFSTVGDLAGASASYLANKDQANNFADEYNSRVAKPPVLNAAGTGQPMKFGSSVNFANGRKAATQPFTFDDLYK